MRYISINFSSKSFIKRSCYRSLKKTLFLIFQFHTQYTVYKDFMNHCFFVFKLQWFTCQMFPSLCNFCGFPTDPCSIYDMGTWCYSTCCPSQFYFLGKLKHAYARETTICCSLIFSCNIYSVVTGVIFKFIKEIYFSNLIFQYIEFICVKIKRISLTASWEYFKGVFVWPLIKSIVFLLYSENLSNHSFIISFCFWDLIICPSISYFVIQYIDKEEFVRDHFLMLDEPNVWQCKQNCEGWTCCFLLIT